MLNENSMLYKLMLCNARAMITGIFCIVGLFGTVCSLFYARSFQITSLLPALSGVLIYGISLLDRREKPEFWPGDAA